MSTSPHQAPMRIGALAQATGASERSIRHYDAHGLLASSRGANGYRLFAPRAVAQVRQIQRLIAAGFSIEEIRGFPECMLLVEGARACSEISDVQRRRLEMLDRQIAELQRRRERLRSMLLEGHGGDGPVPQRHVR